MERDLVVEAVDQMPVASMVTVIEPSPRRVWIVFWMHAIGDEPGGVRVTQVVDPARRAHGFGHGSTPYSAERPSVQQRSPLGRPHHVVDRWTCLEMPSQRVHNDAGERDGSLGGSRSGRTGVVAR